MFATSSTVAKRFRNELGRKSAKKERSISSSVRLRRNVERGFAGDEDDATPAARQHFREIVAAQADAAHDVRVEDPTPQRVGDVKFGIARAALAMRTLSPEATIRRRAGATILLVLAIVGLHFTAMAAVVIVPNPLIAAPSGVVPPACWPSS
jgi:hypothetical protein